MRATPIDERFYESLAIQTQMKILYRIESTVGLEHEVYITQQGRVHAKRLAKTWHELRFATPNTEHAFRHSQHPSRSSMRIRAAQVAV